MVRQVVMDIPRRAGHSVESPDFAMTGCTSYNVISTTQQPFQQSRNGVDIAIHENNMNSYLYK